MSTFTEFLHEAARKGEAVNTLFEQRLYQLVGLLHCIADTLTASQIPYEVIGGLAVLIHVEEVSPEQSSLTRDVDLMVRRSDLERIKEAAARSGFRFRHAAGVDMLIYGDAEQPSRNAVRLVCSGEKVRPHYPAPTPNIAPQRMQVQGKEVMVIPVADLVTMKLTSYRLKDQVHVKTLDDVGLITSDVEDQLSPELRERLTRIRQTE